jgi:hypothetical protein
LQKEIDDDPAAAPVLQPLKERAERILRDLENRKTTGLAAMDLLAALAAEKEAAAKAAADSGLSMRAFAVYRSLRDDAVLKGANIAPMDLAREVESLMTRFPNAAVNTDALRRRVHAWAVKLRVDPRIVRVQAMRWKWGSCSTHDTITLASDLLSREARFQDYVIVHELLHLRVRNHGRLFKTLMTAYVPGWERFGNEGCPGERRD